MKKNKIMLVAVVIVVAVAGFAFLYNEGYLDTILTGDNTGGEGNTNTAGTIVGNWTFVDGTQNGQPVTHIASGWINYKADSTWTYFYDYGYTTVNAEGTWQAQDGQLNWGTNGSEISDWYSVDGYQIVGDVLTITSDTSVMNYRRS